MWSLSALGVNYLVGDDFLAFVQMADIFDNAAFVLILLADRMFAALVAESHFQILVQIGELTNTGIEHIEIETQSFR